MANEFEGLSRDTRRVKTPTKMWEFARNILLTKGFTSVANEDGFDYKHMVPGIILGVIASNDEIVYLSLDGDYSCIGYVNSNIDDTIYNLVIRTNNPKFRFNLTCPIEGIYTYNYKREMIVAFSDGVKVNSNKPRLVNIHNPQVRLDADGELINQNEIGLLNMFPETKEGEIKITYNKEGILDADLVYITYSYVFDDNTDTVFYPIHKIAYVSVGKDQLDKRSITINISGLDGNFNKLRLGLLVVREGGLFGYQSNIFGYNGTDFRTTVNSFTNYSTINTDELVLTKQTFDKIQTLTRQNNQLIVANTVKEELKDFQKYANMLKLKLTRVESNFESTTETDLHNYPTYMPDEVYAFYISLQQLDGNYTRDFHIPGIEAVGNEKDLLPVGELTSMGLADLEGQNFRNFHIKNTGTYNPSEGQGVMTFGYWENEETYPNTDDYNSTVDYNGNALGGIDNRNQPIRYHRMPGLDEIAKEEFDTLGNETLDESLLLRGVINVENFLSTVPPEILNKIQGYKISFVKRNRGDSLVETNTTLVKSIRIPLEVAGVDYDTESTYVKESTNQGMRFYILNEIEQEFGNCKAYNTDLYKFKPRIDPTILKANYAFKLRFRGEPLTAFKGGLIEDTQRYGLFEDITYLPSDNIAANTRHTEETILIKVKNTLNVEESTWKPTNLRFSNTSISGISDFNADVYDWNGNSYDIKTISKQDALSLCLNCTMINLQKNVYTGFKSTNLVAVGRTTINDPSKQLKEGGDVFTNNKIDMTIQHNLPNNTRSNLKFSGLYSVTNNTVLETDAPPIDAGDADGILAPADNSDLGVLDSFDYQPEVEGEEVLSTINTITTGITYDSNDIFVDYFPYRINRGLKIPNESLKTRALRTFLSEDFYEMRNDRGVIIALRATNKILFIQQEFSLFIAQIKDSLDSGETETYLGESDLFDRTPDEILYNENKGYIGCTSQFACFIYRDGYVTVDQIQGKIFIVSNSAEEVSKYNMRNYFKNSLDIGTLYTENDRFGNPKRVDNPFISVGHLAGFDDDYDRLIFTKRMFKFKFPELVGIDYTFDGQFYKNNSNVILDFNNKELFENLSETFSLNLAKNKRWVCNHDYFPSFMYNTNTGMYSSKSRIGSSSLVYKHNSFSNKGLFYGERFESYIDLIFNTRLDLSKKYEAVTWISEVISETGARIYDKTIDAMVIYTDHQCSGRIDIKNGQFDVTRITESEWNLNEFRDLTLNRDFPVIGETGGLIENNIDLNKIWYEKSDFISNFVVVRLIIDNKDNLEKYIHTVNVKSRISKR